MREQRLVFGEVAERYDRHRPSYPDELIDDLGSLAGLDGTASVLEVGSGTGKATRMFAARGIRVLGIEPDAAMAALARRNTTDYANVELVETDFEAWDPRGRTFPLVFSAQAWHWVDPAVGYAKVREVLSPRGLLAPFWNRFAWERSELREAMAEAYLRAAPGLTRAGGMHPVNLDPDADAGWEGNIAAVPGLGEAEVRNYEWDHTFSTGDYVGLLDTTSDVRLLDPSTRERLLTAVAAVIDGHGGEVRIRMRTLLCLARRL
ncbi:MAG TPA: methyltransferase domain-containing protein [Solirubrobacteraceae bacterium]|nr:methyltransferase domain-containing protein [Solirubrobacteraceae bacterium]